MTKFLMIRHGQSEANLHKCFAGHMDSPATELGMQQAQITARYIAQNYNIHAVYSSDLKRAAAVGEAVSAEAGVPLTLDAQLREINAGRWESVGFDELVANFPAYKVWVDDIGNSCCDGGETVQQLQQRIRAALERIAAAHPDQTVVITTHATPIRTIQCICEGKSLSQMKNVPWVSNASVTEIFYENGVFTEGKVAQDSHLGDLVSILPPNV